MKTKKISEFIDISKKAYALFGLELKDQKTSSIEQIYADTTWFLVVNSLKLIVSKFYLIKELPPEVKSNFPETPKLPLECRVNLLLLNDILLKLKNNEASPYLAVSTSYSLMLYLVTSVSKLANSVSHYHYSLDSKNDCLNHLKSELLLLQDNLSKALNYCNELNIQFSEVNGNSFSSSDFCEFDQKVITCSNDSLNAILIPFTLASAELWDSLNTFLSKEIKRILDLDCDQLVPSTLWYTDILSSKLSLILSFKKNKRSSLQI